MYMYIYLTIYIYLYIYYYIFTFDKNKHTDNQEIWNVSGSTWAEVVNTLFREVALGQSFVVYP